MIMAAAVLICTEDAIYLKALGITCLIASQLLPKAIDDLADRLEQMSTRETALHRKRDKERIFPTLSLRKPGY